MTTLWSDLPLWVQNLLILAALLSPLVALAVILRRGFAPGPLALALLRRFAWINAVFVALIAISVGMGIGLVAQERGLREGTAAAASKFDLVVTAPGSEITMLLAAVYLRPADVPLIDGPGYDEIVSDPRVRFAAPIAFGDSFDGNPVVGTTADFVTHLSDDTLDGRLFETEAEAVIGALIDVPLGGEIEPAHGHGDAAAQGAHGDFRYEVVGRMAATGSPWDRAVLVPVESVWSLHGLASGHAPEDLDDSGAATTLGPPFDPEYFPGTPAVIVVPRSLGDAYALRSAYTRDAETMAFLPGAVLAQLYGVLGDIRTAMSVMSAVAQGLVAASVLTGLVLLLRLFERHLALLRALGAPTRFLLALVWSYAAALLALGGVLGLGLGWAVAAVLSDIITTRTTIAIPVALGWSEVQLVAGFVAATACLALLPAWYLTRRSDGGRVGR